MGFGITHAYGHVTSHAFGLASLFAGLSLCASLAAVYISVKALTDSKRPVLVFERTQDGWIIKNVGNGPALNLVFAAGDGARWLDPYKVPSISKDGSYQLKNLKAGARLGVAYFDFDQNLYSSECTAYIMKLRSGENPTGWPAYKASDLPFDWSPKGGGA